jgi:formate/nitrite transporter FocA (FNT family)
VVPKQVVADMLEAARRKAALSVRDLLIRGILAGVFLGYATSLVMVVLAQGLPPIVGAILFPVGFVMLVLLGLELGHGQLRAVAGRMVVG